MLCHSCSNINLTILCTQALNQIFDNFREKILLCRIVPNIRKILSLFRRYLGILEMWKKFKNLPFFFCNFKKVESTLPATARNLFASCFSRKPKYKIKANYVYSHANYTWKYKFQGQNWQKFMFKKKICLHFFHEYTVNIWIF